MYEYCWYRSWARIERAAEYVGNLRPVHDSCFEKWFGIRAVSRRLVGLITDLAHPQPNCMMYHAQTLPCESSEGPVISHGSMALQPEPLNHSSTSQHVHQSACPFLLREFLYWGSRDHKAEGSKHFSSWPSCSHADSRIRRPGELGSSAPLVLFFFASYAVRST